MGIRTLAQLPFAGKRVILRCDLNVPIKNGEISDDGRIRSSLSTINILLENNCSIVIIAHLGRPKGEVKQELSLEPVAKKFSLLPNAAGNLIVAEVEVLEKLTQNPERPYGVILGGAKVSDKIAVISNLLDKVDLIAIGGGMVFTFLAAQGKQVGKSLVETDLIPVVKDLIDRAEKRGVELLLPTDIIVASEFAESALPTLVEADQIPIDQMGLDIGPRSAESFAKAISKCKTVFWNGPMGVFEFSNYANGTKAIARAMSELNGMTVVGGGDSAAAVRKLGFADKQFGYISTGGGASLEYLEGKQLPGLVALS